jgi:hypothetical protein
LRHQLVDIISFDAPTILDAYDISRCAAHASEFCPDGSVHRLCISSSGRQSRPNGPNGFVCDDDIGQAILQTGQ